MSLGLGLNCPQVGGLSNFICGGVNPIMDAEPATISAGSIDILNDYCDARGRAKFIADWLPGGGALARHFWGGPTGEALGFHQLSVADLDRITEENSGARTVAMHTASEGLKTASESEAFLHWFRAASGVPKTLAGKWLGRAGLAALAIDAGMDFRKEWNEIVGCRAGN